MPEFSLSDLASRPGIVRDAARFTALSGGTWLLDLTLLVSLERGLGWPPMAANVVSSLVAAAVVYLVAHRRIHDGVGGTHGPRLLIYLTYTLGVIGVASGLLAHLHTVFAPFGWPATWVTIAAKVAVTPPQLICNFAVSRLIARFPARTA